MYDIIIRYKIGDLQGGIVLISIAVCDDDTRFCTSVYGEITDISIKHNIDLDVRVFRSGNALYNAIENGEYFDIIFLDIILGNENGIDIAKSIRDLYDDVLFIFLTGFIDFAVQGYEARAFRYILKDRLNNEIEKTLLDAISAINERPAFSFSYKHTLYRINVADILYFESDKRMIIVHTKNEQYCFYGKLDETEDITGFIRIHKSYLVNPKHIKSLTKTSVSLDDGTNLSVSDSYSETAKRNFMIYL